MIFSRDSVVSKNRQKNGNTDCKDKAPNFFGKMFSLSGLLQCGEIWSRFGARNTPCFYQLVSLTYQFMFTMKTRSGKESHKPGFHDVEGPKSEGRERGGQSPHSSQIAHCRNARGLGRVSYIDSTEVLPREKLSSQV